MFPPATGSKPGGKPAGYKKSRSLLKWNRILPSKKHLICTTCRQQTYFSKLSLFSTSSSGLFSAPHSMYLTQLTGLRCQILPTGVKSPFNSTTCTCDPEKTLNTPKSMPQVYECPESFRQERSVKTRIVMVVTALPESFRFTACDNEKGRDRVQDR